MSEPNRPDERFTLASERTCLGCRRSSRARVAGGSAGGQLVPHWSPGGVGTTLGLTLIALAAAAALVGMRRWLQVKKALEDGAAMPEPHALWLFALALAGVAVAAGVATVVTSLAR